jgi:murein DD-endopeptidase MepM/ murein hydrolase activator NlpD
MNPDEYMIEAKLRDFVQNAENDVTLLGKVVVKNVKFPKQKGFVVPKGKLEEEKEVSISMRILEEALEKWLHDSPTKKLWNGHFEVPINLQRVATPFGEIRTTPEKGRYLHKAVDILDYPRSVVWASQNGRVIIKDRFLESGNTVVIDHGLGVFTLYFHLDDFADIEVGDDIKKGNPIGKLGMTGYANGYHLHWELRVNNVAVDPFEWTKKTF